MTKQGHSANNEMDAILQKMQQELRSLTYFEGSGETGIPHVTAWRFTGKKIQMPPVEHPYLYIVLDGTLRLYALSATTDDIAGQYFVSRVDTPLSNTVLVPSQQNDFLGLSVAFTIDDVIATVFDLEPVLLERLLS